MNAVIERCETCGAMVDSDDLFCSNCGTEVPDAQSHNANRLATEAKNFQCRSCGATMNYDASARALKCPFCGSIDMVEDTTSHGILAPEFVIPFAFDRAEAERRLRMWFGTSFWHPTDLRTAAALTELRPVYVPFWIFDVDIDCHWTADSDRTPPGSSSGWFPISGSRQTHYDNVWIPASSAVSAREIGAILPFDPSAAVRPEGLDLLDVTIEQFSVPRRYARPEAQRAVEALEAQAIATQVPGRERNVHVNVLLHDGSAQGALGPIYILAYRYHDQLFRCVINGQTAKITGSAPVSWKKPLQIIGVIAAIIAFILLISALSH
jgi:predicted RNA-binding Zn-ribbon protein involved in translation (DUF1610 family)